MMARSYEQEVYRRQPHTKPSCDDIGGGASDPMKKEREGE